MSRVGKMPVAIPAGVDVSIKEDQISVKGTGGSLNLHPHRSGRSVANDDGKLSFEPANDSREANAMSGTIRQLVNNMVVGVTKGFEKKLNLVGVGFKAAGARLQAEPASRLLAPGQQRHAARHHGGNADPDRNHDQGCRSPTRRPGRR